MTHWLQGTICDNSVKILTPTQRERNKRQDKIRRRKNVVILAKKRGRTVGQALRAFELKERYRNKFG